ncbi:MAG: hypothetical protein OXI24_20315 [Candidatus Poribacteria bacterium]|nr:hypothetical protein [Candidatus Poribacteria bacterium]
MKEQDTINKKTEKQPHPIPRFRSLLNKIFKQVGKGKGNYSVDRHKQPMPDIETILEEARKLEETE